MKQPAPTAAPVLSPVSLGALSPLEVDEFTDPSGDDLEGRSVGALQLPQLRWSVRRRIDASQVTGLSCRTWTARALVLSDSRLEALDVLALTAPDAGWRDSEVVASRLGAMELYDANFRRMHFSGCKLGFVNLRGADLADVAFTDCIIEELDLMRATAKRMSFSGCRIGRLELADSHLSDVDLRGAELVDIGSPDGLRGVTVSADQLLDLAPILAARLGIRVE